jgi:hypothetical protein
MSYSIREGVDELKEKLESEIEIAKLYPDATLRRICGQQLWTSEAVVPTDFDVFISDKDIIGEGRGACLLGYVKVKTMRVYQDITKTAGLHPWDIKDRAPTAYAALVEWLKRP